MKNILDCRVFQDYIDIIDQMYRLGWDERNGGNVSLMLDEDVANEYLPKEAVRLIPLPLLADEIVRGKVFAVTGTGKYFRNTKKDPAHNCGIIRVSADGKNGEVLWGFEGGSKFTSEIYAHLMCHAQRLKVNPANRVVMHCHPTYINSLSTVIEDEKAYTKALWGMETECIVVFPEGIAKLPWMLCGTNEIGVATAECMKDRRLVVWSIHGIYGCGNDIDEAFGLIETAEKAAQMYFFARIAGGPNVIITDAQLKETADLFKVTPREGYLDL